MTGSIRNFIRTFAVLTLVGIIGAIYWLMYARKPVVDLHCMKDRNFAISSLLMAGMADDPVRQFGGYSAAGAAGLGYTATWSGLVLSPGAVLIVLTIPLVLKLMPVVHALDHRLRLYLPGGVVLLVPHADAGYRLRNAGAVPQRSVDWTGVPVCAPHHHCLYLDPEAAQCRRRRCLPCSATWPARLGFLLSTAAITERSQAHSAHLAYHASPFNEQFQLAIREAPRRSRTSPLRWAIRPALPPDGCTRR